MLALSHAKKAAASPHHGPHLQLDGQSIPQAFHDLQDNITDWFHPASPPVASRTASILPVMAGQLGAGGQTPYLPRHFFFFEIVNHRFVSCAGSISQLENCTGEIGNVTKRNRQAHD